MSTQALFIPPEAGRPHIHISTAAVETMKDLTLRYENLTNFYLQTVRDAAKETGLRQYWVALEHFYDDDLTVLWHEVLAKSYLASIKDLDAVIRYRKEPPPEAVPALTLELDESYDFFEYAKDIGTISQERYESYEPVAERSWTLLDVAA